MASKKEMLEMLEEEQEILENRIIAEKDGALYVTFHDAAVLNSANAYESKGTGMRTYNRDGSLASTGKTVHAVNPDYFFMNRYKVKGNGSAKRLYIVSGHTPTGYRLIKEQGLGRTFTNMVPVSVIKRNENGELELEKNITISGSEFIAEYTSKLSNATMAEVLPLIVESGSEMTADTMPI